MAKHSIGQLFHAEVFIVQVLAILFVGLMLMEMSQIMSKQNSWSFIIGRLPHLSLPGEVFHSFGHNVPT